MLLFLSQHILEWSQGTEWAERLSWLRMFRYITVRTAGAAVTALALSWWLGPKVIRWLKRLSFGETWERVENGPAELAQKTKRGTPTAGGLLIVLALSFSTLLWAQMDNPLVELTLLSVIVLCGLGFYDDYAKIAKGNAKGETSLVKLAVQTALALFMATIVKVFLFDMSKFSTPYRIFSFMILGMLLVGTSFIYHKYKNKLLPQAPAKEGEKA